MRNYLRNQYKEINAYLKRNKVYIGIVLLLIAELMVYTALNAEANIGYEEYLAETMPAYSNVLMFVFFENLKSSGKILLAGLIPFGFGSLTAAIITVWGLGTSFEQLLLSYPLQGILLSVAPHGLFEFAAMVGTILFSSLLSKEITLSIVKFHVPKNISTVIKGWCFVVVSLLIIGAVAEVTISPVVMELVLR